MNPETEKCGKLLRRPGLNPWTCIENVVLSLSLTLLTDEKLSSPQKLGPASLRLPPVHPCFLGCHSAILLPLQPRCVTESGPFRLGVSDTLAVSAETSSVNPKHTRTILFQQRQSRGR